MPRVSSGRRRRSERASVKVVEERGLEVDMIAGLACLLPNCPIVWGFSGGYEGWPGLWGRHVGPKRPSLQI